MFAFSFIFENRNLDLMKKHASVQGYLMKCIWKIDSKHIEFVVTLLRHKQGSAYFVCSFWYNVSDEFGWSFDFSWPPHLFEPTGFQYFKVSQFTFEKYSNVKPTLEPDSDWSCYANNSLWR